MNAKIPVFEKFDSEINFKAKEKNTFKLRLYALPFFILFVFSILFVRLFQLTIVRGAYYQYISEKNRVKEIPIDAPRGKIVDRNGYSLAYSLQKDDTQKRLYNDPLALAHLIGYRQLASQDEINQDACGEKLQLGDKVGKSGLEKIYECVLRGQKGKKLEEINAQGKALKTLSIQPPIEGDTVTTSIDLDLQKKAYELIKDKKASIIVTKADTGEILAMVSTPSYNPEDFENNNGKMITQYFADKNQPMFFRAIRGLYPPGSVFKTTLAVGALQDKIIDSNFQITDNGFLKAGAASFGNWYYLEYGKTEGQVDVVKAIQRSNDTFFYEIGNKLGVNGIKKWATIFGYGSKTGILLDDTDGLVPSQFWKQENLHDQWYTGDTYNLSIGQGYLQVTPLQVNLATLPLANGGNYCEPKLLKIGASQSDLIDKSDTQPNCHSLHLSKETLSLVREGMQKACTTGGTGWTFFDYKIKGQPFPVGCKTGTAESHGEDDPHAWFTVFAPFDKPQIVVTVMIEEGGQGSDIAGPIASQLVKDYFER